MKYLKIHKLIWFILVIVYTAFDVVISYSFMAICILWNFKIPRNWWRDTHTRDEECPWGDYIYSDANILETIKRRYLLWKEWK